MTEKALDLQRDIEPWEKATISNNVMFRLVMEKPGLCKKLIERLLNIKIARMESPIFEKDFRENMTSRGIRLDVYVEDADGLAIDVEIQAVSKSAEELGKRTRYYQSVMDNNLLAKNIPYTKLRKSYIIFICTFDPYGQGLPVYTFTNICHEDNSIDMCDDATKIFFNATGPLESLTAEQTNLMIYINGGSANDEFTRELDDTVKTYRMSAEKRAIFMTYAQEILVRESKAREEGEAKGRIEGRAEGRVEGKAEGRAEGALRTVISLLHKGRLTEAEAAEETGMSLDEFRKAVATQ